MVYISNIFHLNFVLILIQRRCYILYMLNPNTPLRVYCIGMYYS